MASVKSVAKDLSWLTPIGAAVNIASGDQPEDMKAMNDYMVRTEAKTSAGQRLKTEWNVWFHNLSWYEKNIDRESWMSARNRLSEFNLANASSSSEREAIERIQKQGSQLELDRLAKQGKSAPIDVTTGKFLVSEADEKVKLKWVLLGATGTVLSGFAAYTSPVAKVPLAALTMLGILGTGTYVAFKVD